MDQLLHDLLEVLPGHLLPLRDLRDGAGAVARLLVGEVDDGAERVIDLSADLQDVLHLHPS